MKEIRYEQSWSQYQATDKIGHGACLQTRLEDRRYRHRRSPDENREYEGKSSAHVAQL